jgi:hypothetical protein
VPSTRLGGIPYLIPSRSYNSHLLCPHIERLISGSLKTRLTLIQRYVTLLISQTRLVSNTSLRAPRLDISPINDTQTPKPEPNNEGNAISRPLGVATPLENFFSQYPEFQSQPSSSPVAEFNRLCKENEWRKDDPEKKDARYHFNIAIKEEFDDLYGSDENDIKNWHKLCRVLQIDPVPGTLPGCRAVSFLALFRPSLLNEFGLRATGCAQEARQSRRPRRRGQKGSPNVWDREGAQRVYSSNGKILSQGRRGGRWGLARAMSSYSCATR